MLSNVSGIRVASTTFFDDVYIFGSALWSQSPNDIDILLVYDDSKLLKVETEKARLEAELRNKIGDVDFHFTTLSRAEMQHTEFLKYLGCYEKLK